MSSHDLPLDIRLQPLVDHLSCPVCMCSIEKAFITTCGHRYCEKCIKESIGRHHKCPCCNKKLEVSSLVRDHQYDELLKVISSEKELAEKKYFDRLFRNAMDEGCATAEESSSPIKAVLSKHLKESLVAHEKYYTDLQKDCKKKMEAEEIKCTNLISELSSVDISKDEFDRQRAELRASCILQKEALQNELDICARLLCDAYDRHLSEHLPTTSVLPVNVTVKILSKNIYVPDLTLRPHEKVEVIKEHIEKHMEWKGDRIMKYGPDCRFLCFGPFSKRTQYEMHQAASDIVEFGATHPDIFILPDGSRPVLEFHLKAGSEIALYGMVQCESDMPKLCFTSTFNPGAGLKVDYFSCRDCGFNWVCRSCMEVCHKDHNVMPYIIDHQPTWACCYCPKKKKCVIQPQQTA